MRQRDILLNLSPLDHRYYMANQKLFDALGEYLSEQAVIDFLLKAEVALVESHIALHAGHLAPLQSKLREAAAAVTSEEVYREEEKTRHTIRALVNVLQKKLPEQLRPLVHLGATSVDILDTAQALRLKYVSRDVLVPHLIKLERLLIRLADDNKEVTQVGRTHGQHAVPLTLGFAFAEYVARLGKSILALRNLADNLRGKLSGAVGAYNATSLIVGDPRELERDYLSRLGLKPGDMATQMVEPEYLLRLLLEYNCAFGIIANLADDLRHLQRSEIDEVRELFTADQVGSSTMPQKRNPWNCEHIKSLWKSFAPRVTTFFMDQISEHQRDLTNSASSRFLSDYLAGFAAALNRTIKVLERLSVNSRQIAANLKLAGDMALAEAAYILLAVGGVEDGHEKVRRATLACGQNAVSLRSQLQKDTELWRLIEQQYKKVDKDNISAEEFFNSPRYYRGMAVEKTEQICDDFRRKMDDLEKS